MWSWFMAGKDLSVEDVAERAELPISTIDNIISGKADIDRNTALRLKRVFGKSAETLFRLQAEYSYYKRFHRIPTFEELPRL